MMESLQDKYVFTPAFLAVYFHLTKVLTPAHKSHCTIHTAYFMIQITQFRAKFSMQVYHTIPKHIHFHNFLISLISVPFRSIFSPVAHSTQQRCLGNQAGRQVTGRRMTKLTDTNRHIAYGIT